MEAKVYMYVFTTRLYTGLYEKYTFFAWMIHVKKTRLYVVRPKPIIAKYTQGYENFVGSHVFFVFFLLFAIKRCPHVLTMNLHADSIFLIVNPGCLTCCAGRHLVLYRNASLVIDLP